MSQTVARIGRPRRLAIDVAAVANLVGTLAKYLGRRGRLPDRRSRSGTASPFWPFLVTGRGHLERSATCSSG